MYLYEFINNLSAYLPISSPTLTFYLHFPDTMYSLLMINGLLNTCSQRLKIYEENLYKKDIWAIRGRVLNRQFCLCACVCVVAV